VDNRPPAPDLSRCRAQYVTPSRQFTECLIQHQGYCPYGSRVGEIYLCGHPELWRIVARTEGRAEA
jgi:hypothetical protein